MSAAFGSGANAWGCSYDDQTHLLWGLRPTDSDPCGGQQNCDTEKLVKQVYALGLCGVKDLRWPKEAELGTFSPLSEFLTTGLVYSAGVLMSIDFKESSWQLADTWSIGTPDSMTLAKDGSIFVADVEHAQIINYRADGKVLKTFKVNAGSTHESFNFKRPVLLSTAPDNTLYLVDQERHRIQQIDTDGNFVLVFVQIGVGDGQFGEITGMAVAPDGSVFVVDKYSNPPKPEVIGNFNYQWFGSIARVQHFTATGSWLGAFTYGSYGYNHFESKVTPGKIAVAADGSLFIRIDTANNEVVHFSVDGTLLSRLYYLGSSQHELGALALAPDGSLFVTSDTTVQHLGANAAVLDTLPGQFQQADDLLLSADGNLWVADTGNNRIQHWRFNAPVNRYDPSTGEALFENVSVGNEHYWVTLKH